MLQGAIAYYRGTGDRKLLDAGIRFVNDFLIPNYGPAPKKPIVSGHPEIEMGLIELYRITGDKRQLDLAGYILQGDTRISCRSAGRFTCSAERRLLRGPRCKGTRCAPCTPAAAPPTITWRPAIPAYWKTLNTLWDDMTTTKMYVTGGVGSRSEGEAFGDAYELPNVRAYGESCAAIGNMMWNWRMLAVTGDAKVYRCHRARAIQRNQFRDVARRHALLLSQSAGVRSFHWRQDSQPLVRRHLLSAESRAHLRVAARIFLQHQRDGIYVHLYDNSELNWHLENGVGLKVAQKTNYPWDGDVEITVTPAQAAEFTFYLRIPGWADHAQVAVNAKSIAGATPGEYFPIRRQWSPGDVIQLQMEVSRR